MAVVCSLGPLNFQSFYYKTCMIASFFCFCPFEINYPVDCLQKRTQPIRRECSVTVSVECIQFLCPLHDFFQKAIPFSFSWEYSHGTASRLSGFQEGSLLFCPHWDDPIQCRPFLCLAVCPSISPTSSPNARGCIRVASQHVTSYFLLYSPHL